MPEHPRLSSARRALQAKLADKDLYIAANQDPDLGEYAAYDETVADLNAEIAQAAEELSLVLDELLGRP